MKKRMGIILASILLLVCGCTVEKKENIMESGGEKKTMTVDITNFKSAYFLDDNSSYACNVFIYKYDSQLFGVAAYRDGADSAQQTFALMKEQSQQIFDRINEQMEKKADIVASDRDAEDGTTGAGNVQYSFKLSDSNEEYEISGFPLTELGIWEIDLFLDSCNSTKIEELYSRFSDQDFAKVKEVYSDLYGQQILLSITPAFENTLPLFAMEIEQKAGDFVENAKLISSDDETFRMELNLSDGTTNTVLATRYGYILSFE